MRQLGKIFFWAILPICIICTRTEAKSFYAYNVEITVEDNSETFKTDVEVETGVPFFITKHKNAINITEEVMSNKVTGIVEINDSDNGAELKYILTYSGSSKNTDTQDILKTFCSGTPDVCIKLASKPITTSGTIPAIGVHNIVTKEIQNQNLKINIRINKNIKV